MERNAVILKKVIRLGLILFLAISLTAPFAGILQPARASGPYVVNISSDGSDSNLSDGICYEGVNGCSLRSAIQQASQDGVATTITFDSSLAGSTIMLQSGYGPIIWAGSNITVDGGANNITISGQNLSSGQSIFQIQGNNNTLKYLVIRDSQWDGVQVGDFTGVGAGNSNEILYVDIYHNVAAGVYIHGNVSGGNGNKVRLSSIGVSSLTASCSSSLNNGYDGIYIDGGADNTIISSNDILCNGLDGIYINGSGGASSNTQIYDNWIGIGISSSSMGNSADGIHDYLNTSTQINNNIISGNGNYGVWLQGSDSVTLINNKIGTNLAGTTAVPNGYEGLAITDNATNNTIGSGTDVADRNIISGNTGSGVGITSGANNNVLLGNYIGLGYNGLTVIPNGLAGVAFFNAYNNALSSGSGDTVKQFVSGNTREGIYAENSSYVIVNDGTYIGVAADTSTPAGNGMEGIMLNASTNGIIRPQKVMNNGHTGIGYAGIAVVGNGSTGNNIIPKTIGANGGLPIDLGNDGHTANGSQTPPGPNNWQLYPSESTPTSSGISGVSCAGCYIKVYAPIGNPIANTGGGNYLGAVTADGTTGAFSYALPSTLSGVTLIACHPTNQDCSEMSDVYYKGNHRIVFLPAIIRN